MYSPSPALEVEQGYNRGAPREQVQALLPARRFKFSHTVTVTHTLNELALGYGFPFNHHQFALALPRQALFTKVWIASETLSAEKRSSRLLPAHWFSFLISAAIRLLNRRGGYPSRTRNEVPAQDAMRSRMLLCVVFISVGFHF
ncbi:hypothetical protein FA13DRAFT_1707920 [Coprinellus micaceus]|uniref:Uncharacterized protein n=1 Tax=Coprinellus micaceus TaxID=71717 RepID=A0A4Y7TJJ2_COPMI|nr:hypothetical protein FA13DRAFT_1707920 [Coprinellus micaceus]